MRKLLAMVIALVVATSLMGLWMGYGSNLSKTDGIHSPIKVTNPSKKSFEVIKPQVMTEVQSVHPLSGTPQAKPPEAKTKPVKVTLPDGTLKVPLPKGKPGKHDPSISKRLEEGNRGQPLGTEKGVRVLIYIRPEYFEGKNFQEALKDVVKTLKSKSAKVVSATANPVVAIVPDEETLASIEKLEFVAYIRDGETPLAVTTAGSVTSQGTYNVSAPYAWSKGYNGTGIRVGVLDIPSGGFSNYQTLIQYGDLPSNTQVYNNPGSGKHGSACAEIIYDVAPGIEGMYLGVYSTTEEMYNVTRWFIDNGVNVVSHSISDFGWGPSLFDTDNDGTPEFWDVYRVINNAVDNGIVWVNAAGNNRIEHWEGNWTDADGDGWLDIYGTPAQNGIELDREGIQVVLNSSYSTTFTAWIRWSDYPYPNSGPTNDFNAYFYCWNGSNWNLIASSEDPQNGAFGQEPLEVISVDLQSVGLADGNDHSCILVIGKYNAPNADGMHFDIWWGGERTYWYSNDNSYTPVVEGGSVTPPADDPKVISVGAVYWKNLKPEWYSALGPAYNPYLGEGYWLKPDVVAPDGVSSASYGVFFGTSAAAPHVAGVVANLLSAKPTLSPDETAWIIRETAKDLNATGADYYTGYGLVNASDATPQRLSWTYPTPQEGSIIDVNSVTLNITTWYKELKESNLTFDGSDYSMTGGSNKKAWWIELNDLGAGEHAYNATTIDKFGIWIVQSHNGRFYVNLNEKSPSEGIDGDPASGPGSGWANDETIAPGSSGIVNGTLVWKDANDAYTSPCTGRTYNITEVQLRADAQYIYVLVKFKNNLPIGTNPAPIVEIGFDTDNDGSVDYSAFAFLNKPGVTEGTAEFLDIYDSSWNNVANNDPTHAVFVALNDVIEMQIPRSVIGNPDGTIGLAALVYEGLGANTICSGSDAMTDNGNTVTSVNLAQVPFSQNIALLALFILGISVYFAKRT